MWSSWLNFFPKKLSQEISWELSLLAVEVHDLSPSGDEVFGEALLGIGAAGGEGHFDLKGIGLGGLFDSSGSSEDDEVGEGDFFATALTVIELLLEGL